MKPRKLPPHVLRELKRHLDPPPSSARAGGQQRKQGSNTVLYATLVLTATAASFPLVFHSWMENLNAKEEALTAPQVRRGAFQNSGTRDVGKDPDWEWEQGRAYYKGLAKSGYANVNSASIPGQYHAAHPDRIQAYEDKIVAFATGVGKNN